MSIRIIHGDARATGLDAGSMHACVTSPPFFGLRAYGAGPGEIGAEPTLDAYVASMVAVGREVRRVLRDDGCWWLNIGHSYGRENGPGNSGAPGKNAPEALPQRRAQDGLPQKSLLMVPARVALALQADGWLLRAECPWVSANKLPGSQRDRPTLGHETIYLLAKQGRYYFDLDAVRREALQPIGAARLTGQHKVGTDGLQTNGKGPSTLGTNQGAAGRSLRTSDFFYDSLDAIRTDLARLDADGGMLTDGEAPLAFDVATMPSGLRHFAMWPPRLVAEMVRASTSEAGACPRCLAPWVRVVERGAPIPTRWTPGEDKKTAVQTGGVASSGMVRGFRWDSHTTGWRPSCGCPAAPPVPCRVLDPFGGSGTTAAVADALGRDGYHVELNAGYLALPAQRIAEVRAALLDETKGAAKVDADANGTLTAEPRQGSLF